MKTAKTNLREYPSFIDQETPLEPAADVVAAPALGVEVGIGGTYVLVGFTTDVELVERSEVLLVMSDATAVPQYSAEYINDAGRVVIKQLSLASTSQRDP